MIRFIVSALIAKLQYLMALFSLSIFSNINIFRFTDHNTAGNFLVHRRNEEKNNDDIEKNRVLLYVRERLVVPPGKKLAVLTMMMMMMMISMFFFFFLHKHPLFCCKEM